MLMQYAFSEKCLFMLCFFMFDTSINVSEPLVPKEESLLPDEGGPAVQGGLGVRLQELQDARWEDHQ